MTAVLYARLVERGEAEWGAPPPGSLPRARDRSRLERRHDRRRLRRRGRPPADLSRAAMEAAYDDDPAARRPSAPRRRRPRSRAPLAGPGASATRTSATSSSAPPSSGSPARRYEQALATHVLEPLGITSGGFGAPPAIRGPPRAHARAARRPARRQPADHGPGRPPAPHARRTGPASSRSSSPRAAASSRPPPSSGCSRRPGAAPAPRRLWASRARTRSGSLTRADATAARADARPSVVCNDREAAAASRWTAKLAAPPPVIVR